jgi:hypothetical protein
MRRKSTRSDNYWQADLPQVIRWSGHRYGDIHATK